MEMRRADVRRNSGGRVLLICGFGTGDADEMERTYLFQFPWETGAARVECGPHSGRN